jgi:hypothetical protein
MIEGIQRMISVNNNNSQGEEERARMFWLKLENENS